VQFTANRRDITILQSNIIPTKQTPIGIVAVGALLVGSVDWTNASGSEVKKGDDLGWFQYGGSTVILLFPQEVGVTWDSDLLSASEKSVETLVRVGEHIGLVSV
jgi:phosphatidylserine decarboxylase